MKSSDAIGDTILRSNSRSQPGPASVTQTVNVSANTQAGTTTTGNPNYQLLWTAAFNKLSLQEQTILANLSTEFGTQGIVYSLESIRIDMETVMNGNRDKAWKLKFRGEDIVMRDIGMKILQWIDKFKQIGDIIVQYDPGHATLPWAAFRFLLMVEPLTLVVEQ